MRPEHLDLPLVVGCSIVYKLLPLYVSVYDLFVVILGSFYHSNNKHLMVIKTELNGHVVTVSVVGKDKFNDSTDPSNRCRAADSRSSAPFVSTRRPRGGERLRTCSPSAFPHRKSIFRAAAANRRCRFILRAS